MYICGFCINANLAKEGSFRINANLVEEELIEYMYVSKNWGHNCLGIIWSFSHISRMDQHK